MRRILIANVALMLFAMATGPALAQGPTATPTVSFIFGHPVLMPTTWFPPPRTAIPIGTPVPMNLNITGGVIIAETANMRSSLFDVMGPMGQFLNFLVVVVLAIWGLMSLYGIIRRSKSIVAVLRTGPEEWPGMVKQMSKGVREIMPKSMIRKGGGGALQGSQLRDSGRSLKDTSKKL